MVMRLGVLDVAAVGAGMPWPLSDSYAALVSQKTVESSAHNTRTSATAGAERAPEQWALVRLLV